MRLNLDDVRARCVSFALLTRVVLGMVPAHAADAAAAPFPAHAEALRSAAADFEAVRYLGRSGSREDYDALTRLEGELAAATPATPAPETMAEGVPA